MREVSDSLHLRRFCLIAIDRRVPDESTVRKLARRLGAEVVEEITRVVIAKAQRETRFRGRAARIDSTVVEADIRYPSVRLADGREVTVTYGQYRTLLSTHRVQPDRAAIFAAHQELLEDPEVLDAAAEHIREGASAAFAWPRVAFITWPTKKPTTGLPAR